MRFLYYGFVFGGLLAIVGFVGGFLLPIVLMPKANQGPLMAFLPGHSASSSESFWDAYTLGASKDSLPPDPPAGVWAAYLRCSVDRKIRWTGT
jgi:hypothetical protein